MARQDVHCDKNIVPMDYEFVLWYDLGSGMEPSLNVNCRRPWFNWVTLQMEDPKREHAEDGRCCLVGLHQIAKANFVEIHGGSGKCDICGAWFRYGDVWRHRATGEHIHVGHDCADKYSMITNREELHQYKKAMYEKRSSTAREMKKAKARDAFIEEHHLGDSFALRNVECLNERAQRARTIMLDIYGKLHEYGSLSEKQIQFVHKLAQDIRKPPPDPNDEPHVPAPTGRVEFQGTVVVVKDYEGDWGHALKMVVKMVEEAGAWLVYCTVPSGIAEAYWKAREEHELAIQRKGDALYKAWRKDDEELSMQPGTVKQQEERRRQYEEDTAPLRNDKFPTIHQWLRGKEVQLKATLKHGKEEHFAFGSRPSGASVVEVS